MSTFEHQDWNTVKFVKRKEYTPKEKSEKQRTHEAVTHMSKLENENYRPPKPEKVLGKALQQARTSKKMSQKDLATKLNTKSQSVQLWEAGKQVIPGQYINSINRVLGINLKQLIKK
tara:strand:+ start:566 stop:916 length:351 start_codon:yes stop_codon:yes gene_type:complete